MMYNRTNRQYSPKGAPVEQDGVPHQLYISYDGKTFIWAQSPKNFSQLGKICSERYVARGREVFFGGKYREVPHLTTDTYSTIFNDKPLRSGTLRYCRS